ATRLLHPAPVRSNSTDFLPHVKRYRKKPFFVQTLSVYAWLRLRRDGACKPIIEGGCLSIGGMRYYLYEFTVVAVINVRAQDHPHRLRLLLRCDRDA
ncbi:hypothetical protein ACIPW4_05675, partial [Pseudomonas sp. NPDC089996]|uniref:hypothetical protein n=1 Tax=Pseudomonas sp. NPDC089996 TaxID=3364474 RepID=UPI003829AE19